VAEDPQHAGALNNLAWLLGERGDARAVTYGERARAADPTNPAIADTLGWLYLQAGEANRALPLLDEAHRGLPKDPEVAYHWATALAEAGDTQRALEALQRLVQSAPSFRSRNAALARIRDLGGAAPR
jgi:predicted Zn-dependent protease